MAGLCNLCFYSTNVSYEWKLSSYFFFFSSGWYAIRFLRFQCKLVSCFLWSQWNLLYDKIWVLLFPSIIFMYLSCSKFIVIKILNYIKNATFIHLNYTCTPNFNTDIPIFCSQNFIHLNNLQVIRKLSYVEARLGKLSIC